MEANDSDADTQNTHSTTHQVQNKQRDNSNHLPSATTGSQFN